MGMSQIDDKSIDLILCDLPYGMTQAKWDKVLSLDKLWKEYNRIIKDNGVIALFGIEPFSSYLRISNIKMYKYDWIWDKRKGTNFLNVKKQPLRYHENISVFYKTQCKYHPQMTTGHTPVHSYTKHTSNCECYGKTLTGITGGGQTTRYPRSIQVFSTDTQKSNIHSTQKPVALLEYLIKTYTDPHDLVLDNCAGSCSTGIACKNTNRRFIGFENDEEIFKKGSRRFENHAVDLNFLEEDT